MREEKFVKRCRNVARISPASRPPVSGAGDTFGRIYVNRNNIIHCSCGSGGTKVRGKRDGRANMYEYMYTHITRLCIYVLIYVRLLLATHACSSVKRKRREETAREREKMKRREGESARDRNSEGIKRISTATPVAQGDCTS